MFKFLNVCVHEQNQRGVFVSFYERFVLLCAQKGVKPSRAASECNINRSNVTSWKNNGYTPRGEVLQRIATYFGVSVGYLLGEEEQNRKPLINEDEELTEYVQMLKTRPECRMLFQLSKNATKDDVEAAVRIIEALRHK